MTTITNHAKLSRIDQRASLDDTTLRLRIQTEQDHVVRIPGRPRVGDVHVAYTLQLPYGNINVHVLVKSFNSANEHTYNASKREKISGKENEIATSIIMLYIPKEML